MAKGKHAAALFEVIHAGRATPSREKLSGLFRTPKWWFKSRAPRAVEAPASATAQADASVPAQPLAVSQSSSPPRPPAVDMLVDPEHHQITFRVSYTSALVSGFAIVVSLVLAYLIGRHTAQGPAQALAGPSTEQILQGPPQPGVLDVQGGTTRDPEPEPAITSNPTPPSNTAGNAAATPSGNVRRTMGLNYVVVQAYPDEAGAKAAVDILQQNGIEVTIEKGLRGWPKSDWFIVVGTQGFSRVRSEECQSYLQRVQQISDKFASRRSFKAFEPMAFKWDRP